MAEKETKNEPKDLIEAVPEEVEKLEKEIASEESDEEAEEELSKEEIDKRLEGLDREEREKQERLASWTPKTQLGRDVRAGKVKDVDKILSEGKRVLEAEVFDYLMNLETDLVSIGQAKGKFGGGKRRAWRQTQKKTKEGNVVTFSAMAIVGDKNGHVGIGMGRAKETLPAREKAIRQAKLNIIKVDRGFENPNDTFRDDPHTVPFKVEGKGGSVRIKLLPAPRGTGLVVGDELKKILRLAGIKDVYGVSRGHTRTTFNSAKACFDALTKIARFNR